MKKIAGIGLAMVVAFNLWTIEAKAETSGPQDIIRQALLGAGTGAISAGVSGGKAGKGALIGAGTNVIGGALFSTLFDSPSQTRAYASAAPSYSYAPAPVRQSYYQPVYSYAPQETYVQPVYAQPVYASSQTTADPNRTIIKQGLLGAGVGAISAGVSGGKAGTGALVGAGTSVIGSALFDMLFSQAPQTPAPVYSNGYVSAAPASYASASQQRKIVRHYDANGKIVSEEEYFV